MAENKPMYVANSRVGGIRADFAPASQISNNSRQLFLMIAVWKHSLFIILESTELWAIFFRNNKI